MVSHFLNSKIALTNDFNIANAKIHVLVVVFSDKVEYDYLETLPLSSHILFGALSSFVPPCYFLCYTYCKGHGYKRNTETENTEKVTRKAGDRIYYVKHVLFSHILYISPLNNPVCI